MKRTLQKLVNCFSHHRVGARALCMILSVILIFYVIPATVYAEVASAFSNEETAETATESAVTENSGANALDYTPVLYEVADLREEGVKHFHLEDGSYVAAQYAYPVHYLDDSGKWQDIDNSLAESGGMFANSTARIKFVKKITGNSTLFALHDGNTKLTMSLIGAKKGTVGEATNYADAESDTELQKMMNLEKLSSRVLYADILDGVDLEYIAQSLNVKENIIVKEKAGAYSYTFELALNNLTAALAENGDVVLTDSDGAVKYTIPAPVVYDAAGVYASASVSRYSLESSNGNGKYLLTVTADAAWMNAAERVFPITVDPTIVGNQYISTDLYIEEGSSNTALQSSDTYLIVSSSNISYWKINTEYLPSLPKSAYISKATISLFAVFGSATSTYIGAYEVSSDWNSHLTWNNAIEDETAGVITDYLVDCKCISTFAEWYEWDITELVEKWYDGYNYGVAFKQVVDVDAETRLFSNEMNVEGYYGNCIPRFQISYLNNFGVEDYYSYSSHSAGVAGNGSLNVATGQLVLAIPTLSTTDSLMPYTPTLVYDSSWANQPYIYNNTGTANTYIYMPYGFKLNICETVTEKNIFDSSVSNQKYYVYADADGTLHNFYESGTNGVYVDESGMQKTLTLSSDGSLSITDDSKQVRVFTKKNSIPDTTVSGAWYLSKIIDESGNAIYFTLDTYFRPTKVSLIPKDGAQIDFLEISYYSTGKLKMIYNPASKDAVVFRYSSTYSGSISTSSTNYLRQIDYAHGNDSVTTANWTNFVNSASNLTNITVDASASYQYNSSGYIMSAVDNIADQEFCYTWSSNKVTELEHYAGSTSGQSVLYEYEEGYTDVRTSGNDEYLGNSDDVITRYIFDEYCRSVAVYSSSVNGTEIYGATVGKYETQDEIKNNLKEHVTLGGSAVNYLLNGEFEPLYTSNMFEHWVVSGAVSGTPNDFDGEGEYSATFDPVSGATASVTQYVFLEAGKYTLSMQYRTQISDGISGAVVVSSTAGSGLSHTEEIPLNVNYDNGIYSVFSTTFDVSSYVDFGDKLQIKIKFTASSNVTAAPIINVDQVMLEKNVGASGFSLIQYGSFDASGLNTSGAVTPISRYWQTESNGVPNLVEDTEPFNNCIEIEGDIERERYVYQRIYQVSDERLADYGTSDFNSNVGDEYLVTGFAYAEEAVRGSPFRIRVDVIYYQGYGEADVTVPHYFDFLPSCKDWQFTGGIVDTKYDPLKTEDTEDDNNDYSCIKAIDICCEYSYQAYEYALFDNISVTLVTDSSIVRNEYYKDGDAIGLLRKVANTYYEEYYEYDEKRNLARVANNRGELTDYTYDTFNRLICTVECDFICDYGYLYPYLSDDPDSQIETTPKTKTEYSYNSYGLCTGTTTSQIDENLEKITGTKTIRHRYSYNLGSGSKIFGSLKYEYDSLDVDIRYYYDDTDGKLLATVNTDEDTGVCYTYDERGNLTGVLPVSDGSSTKYTPTTDAESVTYTYDSKNLLATVTTESTTYSFAYDLFGNVTGVDADDVSIVSYEYNDHNGKLNTVTYSNGFSVEYFYNDIELLKEVWYTDSTNVRTLAYEYEYTSSGQVHEFIDHLSNRSTVYKYDTSGRMVAFREYENDDFYHDYSADVYYNDKGQLSGIYYDVNHIKGTSVESAAFSYSYQYNTDDSLKSTTIRTSNTAGGETFYYDDFGRLTQKVSHLYVSSNSAYKFRNQIDYTYKSYSSFTSDWVETYTSTVNNGAALTYTFTYDMNGNITKIVYSTGEETRYVYDDLGQLLREDNGVLNNTRVYTYDNAGNILTCAVYAYTAEGTTPTNPQTTYTYGYSSTMWGDVLTTFNGRSNTYDAIGNPLSYYNGTTYNFSWTGTDLTGAVKSGTTYSFTYNDEGIRTAKTKSGVTTAYYLSGSQVVAEETNGNLTVYLYDAEGLPLGMRYHGTTYAETRWDTYWYEKNIFGDVVAAYDNTGTVLVRYKYDAYGKPTITYYNGGASTAVAKNPFMFRGYYYDSDLQLYYLNARYYDANTGRFISPDRIDVVCATPGALTDKNLYAYCDNNSVMRRDDGGQFWDTFFDVVSLGFSVVDVIATPSNPWAWAGLVGDVVDLIPFVTGVGEVTDLLRVADGVSDAIKASDNIYDTAKTIDNAHDAAKELHRPYIRKSTREAVESRALRNADGKFLDANDHSVVIEGKYDLGHVTGHEFWREKKMAMEKGWTQKQFNDYMNNPEFYRIEDPHLNRSHKFEMPK